MRDDNERKREIERFAEENKLKKYMKEIERAMKKDQMEHEEKIENLSIKSDDMQRRNNNERKMDEERHQNEKNKQKIIIFYEKKNWKIKEKNIKTKIID